MGIDIYLGGYDAYNIRAAKDQAAFELAVKTRDALSKDDAARDAAQYLVNLASDRMWHGRNGYLRSNYNNGGLFNVLDRIFGTDSAELLFPGDWNEDLELDWDKFLGVVAALKAAAVCLKHGDPLPIAFDEFKREPNPERAGGEALGKQVAGMLTAVVGEVVAGNDHQHGFFNLDDYGWYVTEGLEELKVFGEVGKREQAEGKDTRVHISY